jgi:hypothetical protein
VGRRTWNLWLTEDPLGEPAVLASIFISNTVWATLTESQNCTDVI